MIEAGAPSLPDLWNRAVLALTDASSEKLGHVLQELIQVNLPLADKYREVDVLSVLRDNASQQGLNAIATAFNILEKYGRNLLSPNKPKFWRAVKFNNPVFKSTVDAVKGGRDILRLYGYTVELRDGMSFPENVADPDPRRVAAVTVEVALLQVELDLLRKGTHPHPELFSQLLSTGTQVQQVTPLTPSVQDPRPKADGAVTPTWTIGNPPSSSGVPSGEGPWTPLQEEGVAKGGGLPIPASPRTSCAVCSAELVSSHCGDCGLLFCGDCGDLYHRHPARAQHQRSLIPPRAAAPGASHREVQNGEVVSLGKEPEIRATPNQTLAWSCPGCQLSNPGQGLVCRGCQLPRASREPPPPSRAAWSCQACTCLNEASSVLCSACDRPRLAGRPSFTPRPPASSIAPALALAPNPDPSPTPQAGKRDPASGWECRHCTYINLNRGRICEVCDRTSDPREGEGEGERVPCGPVTTARPGQHGVSAELDRQRAMREDGLRLITAIRMAEEQQVSPEEVVCALRCAGDISPLSWLETGLTQALESISELALQQGGPEVGLVGREEAHQAWLSCGGSVEEAARRCAQERRRKVGELEVLGFRDRDEVLQTLYMNGGDVDRALVDLQRRLLQPFHNRIWQEHQEPIQLQLPDKERVLRQILATYSLQSWGRAEIVLSLMLEGNQHYQLSDVVEAVKESADREFIKRCLSLLCPICFSLYPRSKVQSLTSCECTICLSCFKEYFTYTVRERNIKNLVCPICSKPDIDDEAQRLSYFSTLDVQLRDCLDTDDYNLFHKKLTERTLMMDPKFKWCTHCSNGFIYDGNQKQVTCPQCQGSFCVECKRPSRGVLSSPQKTGSGLDGFAVLVTRGQFGEGTWGVEGRGGFKVQPGLNGVDVG
ncbi:E3 ubiquitin-protein ligase RNF31 [Mobula hypostoma]|uniref:E3 ubiquitin-protein ligase RNF31 n=1 Tax=Mobula hypostoma TaxID=723540 RepID=UPI002FC3AE02